MSHKISEFLSFGKISSPKLHLYKNAIVIKIKTMLICKFWQDNWYMLSKKTNNCEETEPYIPSETSPATAISWKLRLNVSFIFETRVRRVGSHLPYETTKSSHGRWIPKKRKEIKIIISIQETRWSIQTFTVSISEQHISYSSLSSLSLFEIDSICKIRIVSTRILGRVVNWFSSSKQIMIQ